MTCIKHTMFAWVRIMTLWNCTYALLCNASLNSKYLRLIQKKLSYPMFYPLHEIRGQGNLQNTHISGQSEQPKWKVLLLWGMNFLRLMTLVCRATCSNLAVVRIYLFCWLYMANSTRFLQNIQSCQPRLPDWIVLWLWENIYVLTFEKTYSATFCDSKLLAQVRRIGIFWSCQTSIFRDRYA